MDKDKKLKVEPSVTKASEYIKDYLDEYVLQNTNYARFVTHEAIHSKHEFCFISTLDYGSFSAKLYFDPYGLTAPAALDMRISYNQAKYDFTIYDIFNLYDIQDFNQYYYDDYSTESEIKIELDDLLSMLEKYRFDIQKVISEGDLDKLSELYEEDRTAVNGSDSWMMYSGLQEEYFYDAHPFFTNASDENKSKILPRLRKKYENGELKTHYEMRLYNYLSGGNAFNDDINADKKQFKKGYLSSKRKASALCAGISVFLSTAVSLLVKAIVFKGAYVPSVKFEIGNSQIPIGNIINILGSAVIIFLGITGLLGKRLFSLVNSVDKDRASQKYDNDQREELGIKSRKGLKMLAIIFLIMGIAVSVLSATDNIGFYEDHVKYSAQTLGIKTVPYEELEIYFVQGTIDDNGNFEKYARPAYAVADKDGNYYEIGEVIENGKTQTQIKKIIKDYNKRVKEIETANELDKEE